MRWLAGMAFAASLVVMPAVAFAQAAVDTKADTQKLADEWLKAYNQKDAATIAKMYTADAVFSGPGWTASGREAIEEGFKKEIAAAAMKVNSITVDQSHRVGNMNYSWGSYEADMKGPDGKDVPVHGHWTVVGQCQDGNCLALDHNSNMAMPPPK
jgi:uncharacterized protein (TIGR02246 family)